MEKFYLRADGDVVHFCTARPWTGWICEQSMRTFLLHGEMRNLTGTFEADTCMLSKMLNGDDSWSS